jgi:hypothetical protein
MPSRPYLKGYHMESLKGGEVNQVYSEVWEDLQPELLRMQRKYDRTPGKKATGRAGQKTLTVWLGSPSGLI